MCNTNNFIFWEYNHNIFLAEVDEVLQYCTSNILHVKYILKGHVYSRLGDDKHKIVNGGMIETYSNLMNDSPLVWLVNLYNYNENCYIIYNTSKLVSRNTLRELNRNKSITIDVAKAILAI